MLNGRLSFYEDELEELERRYKNFEARRLGLVYKEESVKRLKPRHAYSFLHKTFQEFLAASYIGQKLIASEFPVLEEVRFPHIPWKFRQVFLFVQEMVCPEVCIPSTQVGDVSRDRLKAVLNCLDVWMHVYNSFKQQFSTLYSLAN